MENINCNSNFYKHNLNINLILEKGKQDLLTHLKTEDDIIYNSSWRKSQGWKVESKLNRVRYFLDFTSVAVLTAWASFWGGRPQFIRIKSINFWNPSKFSLSLSSPWRMSLFPFAWICSCIKTNKEITVKFSYGIWITNKACYILS